MTYVCRKKCYFRKKLWKVGETLKAEASEVIPSHFVVREKYLPPEEKKLPEEPKTFSELAKSQANDIFN